MSDPRDWRALARLARALKPGEPLDVSWQEWVEFSVALGADPGSPPFGTPMIYGHPLVIHAGLPPAVMSIRNLFAVNPFTGRDDDVPSPTAMDAQHEQG